jgi:hypothetical protein
MLEQNDEWSLQRRYTQLEGLLSMSNQPALLCAVINGSAPSPLENHIAYTTPADTILFYQSQSKCRHMA